LPTENAGDNNPLPFNAVINRIVIIGRTAVPGADVVNGGMGEGAIDDLLKIGYKPIKILIGLVSAQR